MSIVINCSESSRISKNEQKANLPKLKESSHLSANNFNIYIDNEEDCRMASDKSVINLPKYLKAHANDLNRKNVNFASNVEIFGNEMKLNMNKEKENTPNENLVKANPGDVSSANINSSSFMSTNSNNKETSWGKKYTIQTYMERNICDEINRVEEEKCLDHMENLNNLSNILKSKTNKLSKFKHNLSSDNLFVYKNMIKCEKNNNYNANKPEDRNGGKANRGLNNGFIYEDNSNYNEYKKYSNTLSQGSIHSIRNSEESQTKTGPDMQQLKTSNVMKREEDNKILKINQKMERIKNSYAYTGLSTKKSSGSYKENVNDSVELTCFQKMCGNKK